MVYAKVTDGKEIRKFRVEAEVTFDALKKQLAGLFPSLAGGCDFYVQYRDTDGDVISISTDEEVRTALSHLKADETWLLQVVQVPKRVQRASSRGVAPTRTTRIEVAPFGGNVLSRLLDDMNPFWTPATSLLDWNDPFGRCGKETRRMEEECRRQTEQLRKMQEDHTKQFEELRKKAEANLQNALKERQSSKQGGAVQQANSGEPKLHVQTFGSWDPQVMECPHGTRTVIGPVGYHMYWGYSDPEGPTQQGQQGEQKREEAKPTEGTNASPTEGTNAPPTEGTNAPPTEGTNAPPTEGSNAPPTESTPAPPTN